MWHTTFKRASRIIRRIACPWHYFLRTKRNAACRFSGASCRPLGTTLRPAAVRRRVAIAPAGCDRHLRAIRDAHPAHDVAHMDLHSALTDIEPPRDRLVRFAMAQQFEHRLLAFGKLVRGRVRATIRGCVHFPGGTTFPLVDREYAYTFDYRGNDLAGTAVPGLAVWRKVRPALGDERQRLQRQLRVGSGV